MYPIRHPSHSLFVPLRGQNHHLRQWGRHPPGSTPLLLLHGWMDVSASWQFMVDAWPTAWLDQRLVTAPDWRGFGQTRPLAHRPAPANDPVSHKDTHETRDTHDTPAPNRPLNSPNDYGSADHYQFADYLADLDALIAHLNTALGRPAEAPIDLVGHSMGGNVAMLYAGIRPERVRRLVNVEGFGLPPSQPEQAAQRYARWLDEIRALRQGTLALKSYPSAQAVAQRLRKTNPRLAPEKADWLATHWAAPDASGQWQILGDAAHKIVNPQLYQADEVLAVWACIRAPLLVLEAEADSLGQWYRHGEYTRAQFHQRLQGLPQCRIERLPEAGHMLHHDQPEALAALLQEFLA